MHFVGGGAAAASLVLIRGANVRDGWFVCGVSRCACFSGTVYLDVSQAMFRLLPTSRGASDHFHGRFKPGGRPAETWPSREFRACGHPDTGRKRRCGKRPPRPGECADTAIKAATTGFWGTRYSLISLVLCGQGGPGQWVLCCECRSRSSDVRGQASENPTVRAQSGGRATSFRDFAA